MWTSLYFASVLFGIAQAASLQKRDSTGLKEDLTDLKTKMAALNTAIDSYKGGVLAAIPVQSAESAVETSITKVAKDVTDAPTPVPEDEAKLVLSSIQDLNPMIKHATDTIISKADMFGSSKGIVKNDMIRLKGYTDTVSTGLVSKSPDSLKQQASIQKSQVEDYFNSTIKVLS